jgi:glutamate carboxypeptidase
MGLQVSGAEQSVLDWLGGQRDAMLALLQTLVNTDSGSYDKPGATRSAAISANFSRPTALPAR